MTKPASKPDDYNEVILFDPKPNKMFPDWMTHRTRFLRYVKPVPCACCGRKSKCHWTMTMNFRAVIFGKQQFAVKPEPQVHPPFTPVCRNHPLAPCVPKSTKAQNAQPTRKK